MRVRQERAPRNTRIGSSDEAEGKKQDEAESYVGDSFGWNADVAVHAPIPCKQNQTQHRRWIPKDGPLAQTPMPIFRG